MLEVRKPAATETEKPGNAVSLAVQYSGTTLFIPVVVPACLMIHDA